MDKILSSAMAEEEISKLTERRNALSNESSEKRSAFDEADIETRDAILAEIESMNKEADEIDAQIKSLEEIRAKYAEQEERMSMAKTLEEKPVEARKSAETRDVYDTPEYRKAWKDYVVTGNDREVRVLTTATEGIPVPTIMQNYIETAWEKYGKISNLVSKSYVKGYLAVPFEDEATGAVVHTEGGAAPAEETITFGQILLQPAMIKKYIMLTDELIALAPEEFMRYISDEIVYRVVKLVDEGIIRGALDTNNKGIVGIVGNDRVETVVASLGFNVVNEAIASLNTFDDLTVVMNPQTFFKDVMGLTDLQGRPIYQVSTDNQQRPQYYINGIRVEFSTALAAYSTTTKAPYAVVGNFRGYRLNLPEGDAVKMLYDPYTSAKEDKVTVLGRLFAAGDIVKLGHFAVITNVGA